jgi:Protein of unknown function (DUF4240)
MTTLLEIPLRNASMSDIQDFQKKFPDAMLRIEAAHQSDSADMDENHFWMILDLLDWEQSADQAILQPAIEALSEYSKAGICIFHDLLNEKLFELDGYRFAVHLGSNHYDPTGKNHFSVDDFLYARCGVVANGKAFFEEVMEHPEQIPKEFTFEALLSLPEQAWQLKSGEAHLDYFPELWYETFSNAAGWPGIKTIKERLMEPR